ncbi:MFS general substrate transporter, partial [Teratosphaeria nubilosa]
DPKNAPFPLQQLIIIGICRFSEPLAFNSILAYSYVMVKDLGVQERDAAFYSGLLLSAYAIAEAITALGWGAISDVYGRKPVALIGLAGVALSSVGFGLAKTYWVALLARFVGGALNGNVAIMQTMVAEMVTNPEHEPRAYATQPFVWTLGGIIGSAMGGFLAQPAKYYPNLFSQDGVFGRFPYLLPNLVAAGGIVLAIIQGMIFLKETKPHIKEEDQDVAIEEASIDERTPLNHFARLGPRPSVATERGSLRSSMRHRSSSVIAGLRELRAKSSFMVEAPMPVDTHFDLRRGSFATMHSIRLPPHEILPSTREAEPPKKTFNFTVVMLILSMSLFAYHQMAYITNLPVWMLDDEHSKGIDLIGGLGLDLHGVGTYLAVNGLITLIVQGLIFPIFVGRFGVWTSFFHMILWYPITYIIIPFLSGLPDILVGPGIYVDLILQAFFGIIVFPCALIMLKNATPSPLVLGRVNGAAMSACCLARTLSSPIVGWVYAAGGSAASWWSLAAVSVIGVIQLIWMPKELKKTNKVQIENGVKELVH